MAVPVVHHVECGHRQRYQIPIAPLILRKLFSWKNMMDRIRRYVFAVSFGVLAHVIITLEYSIPQSKPPLTLIVHISHQHKRPSLCPVLAVNPVSIVQLKGVNEKHSLTRARVELALSPSDHNADRFKSAGGDLVSGCFPTFDTIII